MKQSDWIIQSADKSHCNQCNAIVDLLCSDRIGSPWFYICWVCKRITEVGLGPIQDERQKHEKSSN